MRRSVLFWRLMRVWGHRQQVQLRLALRVTAAAMLALVIAQAAHLHLPLWAVLTAVVVSQVSVGGSLKATVDYLASTIGGAIYGGAVAIALPHESKAALLAVLAIALAPMALIAATYPRLKVAPMTAIIVLLVPEMTHVSAIASAIDRVLEVAVGGLAGFLVSFFLLPSRAHGQTAAAAARTLDRIARALTALLGDHSQGLEIDALHRLQDGIGQAITRLNVIGSEANHERMMRIADEPETGPLTRTLLRLRHDLVMIGRAVQQASPEAIQVRLRGPLDQLGTVVSEYLVSCGHALRSRLAGPAPDAHERAFDTYIAEVEALRRDGSTRLLNAEEAERFFALGFAFEQMRKDLRDLERCVNEWAESSQRVQNPAMNESH